MKKEEASKRKTENDEDERAEMRAVRCAASAKQSVSGDAGEA
jgi:hypothetical protein